jgi:hypothetical protein
MSNGFLPHRYDVFEKAIQCSSDSPDKVLSGISVAIDGAILQVLSHLFGLCARGISAIQYILCLMADAVACSSL